MEQKNRSLEMDEYLKLRSLREQLLIKVRKSLQDGFDQYGREITEIMWDKEIQKYAPENPPISKGIYYQLAEAVEKLEHAENIIALFIANLLNGEIADSKQLIDLSKDELNELISDEYVESYFDKFHEKHLFEKKWIKHGKNLSGRFLEKRKELIYRDLFEEMDKRRLKNPKTTWSKVIEDVYKRYDYISELTEERLYKSFMKLKDEYSLENLSDFENRYVFLRK